MAQSQTLPGGRPEEIVVTSSIVATPRRQIGAAVGVLPVEEIELRGYSSLADALRTQPGVAVTNSGGSGKNTVVRIRGEEHYRTLLMIDGVKALDTSAPQVAPSFDSLLTTNDLERVEVLRGPQGFIYGADAGGVVNVLTKRGAGDFGGRLGLEYGEFSTRKIDGALSGGGDRGDYYVSVTDLIPTALTRRRPTRFCSMTTATTTRRSTRSSVGMQAIICVCNSSGVTSMPRPRTTAASHRRLS